MKENKTDIWLHYYLTELNEKKFEVRRFNLIQHIEAGYQLRNGKVITEDEYYKELTK